MNSDIILNMGIHTYVAKIEHDKEDGTYLVTFPSLKGCITYGKTIEEAIYMAKDVLEGYLECLIKDGERLPIEKKSLLNKRSEINITLSVSV